MPLQFNRVTWYSKLLAVVVLLLVIAEGAYFGSQFAQIKQDWQTAKAIVAQDQPQTHGLAGLLYKNERYGFLINLPASWQGYQVVSAEWQGATSGDQGEVIVSRGPVISLRYPLWTASVPRRS